MVTTPPLPNEKGDSFTNEEEEEDDVVMATNSSITEESSEGWDDQAPPCPHPYQKRTVIPFQVKKTKRDLPTEGGVWP